MGDQSNLNSNSDQETAHSEPLRSSGEGYLN